MANLQTLATEDPSKLSPRLRQDWFRRMTEKRSSIRWAGILALVVGLLSIIFPFAASLSLNAMAAAILLITGGVMVWTAFSQSGWSLAGHLAGGLLALLAGLFILLFPLAGILWLTLILVSIIAVEGIMQITMALRLRPASGWGWVLVSGIVSVLIALAVLLFIPALTPVLIGLFFGFNLIATGVALLVLSTRLTAENLAKSFPDPRAENTERPSEKDRVSSEEAVPIPPNVS